MSNVSRLIPTANGDEVNPTFVQLAPQLAPAATDVSSGSAVPFGEIQNSAGDTIKFATLPIVTFLVFPGKH